MVNWATHLTEADMEGFRYRLSDPAKEVPLMDFASSVKATKPIEDFFCKKHYNRSYSDIN